MIATAPGAFTDTAPPARVPFGPATTAQPPQALAALSGTRPMTLTTPFVEGPFDLPHGLACNAPARPGGVVA